MNLSVGIFWANNKKISRDGIGFEFVSGAMDFGRLRGLIIRLFLWNSYEIYNNTKCAKGYK